jgi:hypothetical protein
MTKPPLRNTSTTFLIAASLGLSSYILMNWDIVENYNFRNSTRGAAELSGAKFQSGILLNVFWYLVF